MSQNDTSDLSSLPVEKVIILTPTHTGIAREFIGLYPMRDKSGKFEEGMFGHYQQCAGIADKYNELVPEHNELEAEAERRRQSIDHLLRWKTAALELLTDAQIDHIHDNLISHDEDVRVHTHYTDKWGDGTCVYTELNGQRCGEPGPWPNEPDEAPLTVHYCSNPNGHAPKDCPDAR